MEELEGLGEQRQVKNSHPRPADTPTHTNLYIHTPLSTICPSSNLYPQPFWGETCLTSHGVGGEYRKVCASYLLSTSSLKVLLPWPLLPP